MNLLIRLAVLFCLFLFFTGCVPKPIAVEPAVQGIVIDKQTKLPIKGVIVDDSIKTDIDGHFILESKSELSVATTMGGNYMIKRSFTLKKEGYGILTCRCEVLTNEAICNDEILEMTKLHGDTNSSFFKGIESGYGLHCYE